MYYVAVEQRQYKGQPAFTIRVRTTGTRQPEKEICAIECDTLITAQRAFQYLKNQIVPGGLPVFMTKSNLRNATRQVVTRLAA